LFVLVLHFPVWSLALSFSISIGINSCVLLAIFYKKIGGFDFKLLFRETGKIMIAACIASVTNYYVAKLLDGLVFDTTRTINVFFLLMVIAVFYTVLYLFLSWLLNIREIYLITKLLMKAKEYQKRILEFNASYE
jgi:putative peptidoglycan lipid II flippase